MRKFIRAVFKNSMIKSDHRFSKEAEKYYRKVCAMVLTISMFGINMLLGILMQGQTAFAEEPVYPVEINETNFPDENFRAWVNNINQTTPGFLTKDECDAVTTIDISNPGGFGAPSISNLTGIQYFTLLDTLNCEMNTLTTLDLSQNTALVELNCADNPLTILDLSQNTALTYLECANNQLTALDVSQNKELTGLSCDNNQLTTLDVSQNTALIQLGCGGNQLTALDISKNTALIYLICEDNQLTALDVSHNKELGELYCENNQLVALDLSKNMNLGSVVCKSQTTTALFRRDKTVDMSNVVGSVNLGKVSLPEETTWSYDSTIGIMTYTGTGFPESLVYNYDTSFAYEGGDKVYMDVTATLLSSSLTATFHPNNGQDPYQGTIDSSGKIVVPIDPTRTNFKFGGWYTSTDGGVTLSSDPFNFDSIITGNIDLYAKWISIDNETPSEAETPLVVDTGDDSFINICILNSLLLCAGVVFILPSKKKESIYE